MSSKKKVYVLFSILGDIAPKIYKSKATVKKYIDKQPNLAYYQFLTEKQAEEYIRGLKKKNQQVIRQAYNSITKNLSESNNTTKIDNFDNKTTQQVAKLIEEQKRKQKQRTDMFEQIQKKKKQRQKMFYQMFQENLKKYQDNLQLEKNIKPNQNVIIQERQATKYEDDNKMSIQQLKQVKVQTNEEKKEQKEVNKSVEVKLELKEMEEQKQKQLLEQDIIIQKKVEEKEEIIPKIEPLQQQQTIKVQNNQQFKKDTSKQEQQNKTEQTKIEDEQKDTSYNILHDQKKQQKVKKQEKQEQSSTSSQSTSESSSSQQKEKQQIKMKVEVIKLPEQQIQFNKSNETVRKQDRLLNTNENKQGISQKLNEIQRESVVNPLGLNFNTQPGPVIQIFEQYEQKIKQEQRRQQIELQKKQVDEIKLEQEQKQAEKQNLNEKIDKIDQKTVQNAMIIEKVNRTADDIKQLLGKYQGFQGQFVKLNYQYQQKDYKFTNQDLFADLDRQSYIQKLQKQQIFKASEIKIKEPEQQIVKQEQALNITQNKSQKQEQTIQNINITQNKSLKKQQLTDIKLKIDQQKNKQIDYQLQCPGQKKNKQEHQKQQKNELQQKKIMEMDPNNMIQEQEKNQIAQSDYLYLQVKQNFNYNDILKQFVCINSRWYHPSSINIHNNQFSSDKTKHNLHVQISTNKSQNPGFTHANYQIFNEKQGNMEKIYERSFKLGVTRNNQSILLATVATLSDIILSQNNLISNHLTINISKKLLKKSQASLDKRIVLAWQMLQKIKNKGFNQF